MSSVIYDKSMNRQATAVYGTGTYKVMLVTSAYTEDKGAHAFRSSVTNEVSGTGYTAGGATVTVTVSALDTTNHRQEIIFGSASWASSTITANKAIYYMSTGNAATDPLDVCIDFGAPISTTGGTFNLNSSTMRHQN